MQQGYEIVGESSDDNVSGMTFDRKGLAKLENAIDEGKVDVVLVKDLSRLGRHRTQTALFIDHLRENNVRVYVHQNEDKSLDVRLEFNGDFEDSVAVYVDGESA